MTFLPISPQRVGAAVCALLLLPAVLGTVPGCRRRDVRPEVVPERGGKAAPGGGVFAPRASIPPERRAEYAGAEACAVCHVREAEQLASHHARTLARVDRAGETARFRQAGSYFDPVLRLHYRPALRGGRPVLAVTDGKHTADIAAEYAFGSGNRGVTYLGRFRGRTVELRLSYYRSLGGWEFSPSQPVGMRVRTPAGRVLEPPLEEACYLCHTTALVQEGGQVRPERSLLGIGCEACHGPGRAHIKAVKRGDADHRMVRLASSRRQVSDELCGQCHRPSGSSEPDNPEVRAQLPRFQGIALSLSACNARTSGGLSCMTCHDPHRDADRTSHAEYNRTCHSCHDPAHPPPASPAPACRFKPSGDCVACHMPAQTLNLPGKPGYHTHWIKVWK